MDSKSLASLPPDLSKHASAPPGTEQQGGSFPKAIRKTSKQQGTSAASSSQIEVDIENAY